MIALLKQPYRPDKANEIALVDSWIEEKNKQIQRHNQQTRSRLKPINNISNWQAAMIYTNQITGLEPLPSVKNDSRIAGTEYNNAYLPFDLEIPEYKEGLKQAELEKRKDQRYKKLGRY